MSRCFTPLLTISSCLALSLSASAQNEPKVPRPLPWVDLDAKVATSPSSAQPTLPKIDAPPAIRPRQQTEPVKVQESVTLPNGHGFSFGQARELLFDTTNGSTIWADAGIYKASFASDGFTYLPYFGASAPRNYPVAFSLERAQLGTVAAPPSFATPRHQGNAVILERGALQERYDLTLDGVEQKFVVSSPFAGDLVLTLRVNTELQATRDDAGLRFSNELGHVGYTDAVLVDAAGNRSAMQTEYSNGEITLRASAASLANATFPVTVDPIVTTFVAGTDTTYVRTNVDIAFDNDPGNAPGHYLVVWTRVFSAADTDLHSISVDAAGAVVGGSSTLIDNTTDRWDDGRVASCGANFLAVASRLPVGGGTRAIWGRIRAATAPFTMGAQFEISSSNDTGDKVSPDVGGEFDGPVNFCVVWQRNFTGSDHDIHYRLVTAAGANSGAVGIIDNASANDDFRPRIAKSDGRQPASEQFWNLAWQRLVGGTQHDIIGRRVLWDGTLPNPSYNIDTAVSDNDTQPSVSSLTDNLGAKFFLVSFTTNNTGDLDIYLRAFRDGATPVNVTSNFLGSLENLGTTERTRDQFQSQTDSDGCRFVVSYLETFGPGDRDAYIDTLDLSPSLRAIDPRVTLTFSNLDTQSASNVANRSGNGNPLAYGAVWDHNSASGAVNSSVNGAIYRGTRPGAGFATRATGCGGLGITAANGAQNPGPGATVQVNLTGAVGPTFFIIGLPMSPLQLCPPAPCAIGATLTVIINGPSQFIGTVPCASYMVDAVLSIQGGAIFSPGGCTNLANLVLSDTLDITIQ